MKPPHGLLLLGPHLALISTHRGELTRMVWQAPVDRSDLWFVDICDLGGSITSRIPCLDAEGER